MGSADIHLALEVTNLAQKFESRNIKEVDDIDHALQEKIAAVEMINALKAAIMRASNNGKDEINFNEDNELKEALDKFLAVFPEGADFVPDDGIVHNDQIAEALRFLDGKAREPMTWSEFLLHKLSRIMADMGISIEALRAALKTAGDSGTYIVRNKAQ